MFITLADLEANKSSCAGSKQVVRTIPIHKFASLKKF